MFNPSSMAAPALCICLTLSLVTPAGAARATDSEAASSMSTAEVSALSFKDFYHMPIGPKGLEPTDKLRKLNGHRVRITGYMVREEEPAKGVFMLTPQPVSLAEVADGPADDLPGTTLFVHLPPSDQDLAMRFRAGRWELVGELSLGGRNEENGRISYARLILDESVKTAAKASK